MEQHIFSVTEVNELVKRLLDNEPMLSGCLLQGNARTASRNYRPACCVYIQK